MSNQKSKITNQSNLKKIVFFGSGYFIIPVIKMLQDQGLLLVVTNEPKGRLVDFLKKYNIPYIYSDLKHASDISRIIDLKPDIGVLASFGAFVPQKVVNAFPQGILNIHPSLLPKFKGPSPIQFTILSGDSTTGVTIIQLDNELDHGPIVLQKEVTLKGSETSQELLESLFIEGAEMIKKIIQDLNNGKEIQSNLQDHKSESWSLHIEKSDGKINLNNPPEKTELLRKIRAYYPWPGVHLIVSLNGKDRLLKLMPYDTVQVEGKSPQSYKDFINGYGKNAEEILIKLGLIE